MFRSTPRRPLRSAPAAGLLVGAFLVDLEHRLLRNRPPAVAVVEQERTTHRPTLAGLMLTDTAAALDPPQVTDRSGARL